MNTSLHINKLKLIVNLGWRNKERDQEQDIFLDMIIRFLHRPNACDTDELNDTTCYATLIDHIRSSISDTHYRLIEHLAKDIYSYTKEKLPPNTSLHLSITKYPRIGGLTGGVSFHYGDE